MTTSTYITTTVSPQSPPDSAEPVSPDGFYVLCLYDFDTTDPDQLAFKQGNILRIVEREDTGWWAALDPSGNKIGWVPAQFVEPMSDAMAATYQHVTVELESARASEPDFSPSMYSTFDSSEGPLDSADYTSPDTALDTGSNPATPYWYSKSREMSEQDDDLVRRSSRRLSDVTAIVPPSPRTPVPQPGPQTAPLRRPSAGVIRYVAAKPMPTRGMTTPLQINKPTPPTPTAFSSPISAIPLARSQSETVTLASLAAVDSPRTMRARPSPILSKDPSLLRRISMAVDSSTPPLFPPTPGHKHTFSSPNVTSPTSLFPSPRRVATPDSSLARSLDDLSISDASSATDSVSPLSQVSQRSRADKVFQRTGDADAEAFVRAKEAQARMPPYLRPQYVEGHTIKLEYDGSVRAGTVFALVERLTVDPLRMKEETAYRRTFLLTFKSFMTADMLFDLLEDRFRVDHPPDLTDDEFQEWREHKLKPTQTRVLAVMREWLEEHNMLQEDHHISQRLRDFLGTVKSPPAQLLTAKQTLQTLDRLTSTPPKDPYERAGNGQVRAPNKKANKSLSLDILKMDVNTLAQQLALFEARLYARVRPTECIAWARRGGGGKGAASAAGDVTNLIAFCATNDKLASWVKMTVLERDGLGKRADTIDHWIKVAEKCRAMNNISSTSAILAALSSVDISRLNLTWAHVGRLTQFQQLVKLTDPTGNFSSYRGILTKVNEPCIPFIGMYLSDLVHYNDRFEDTVGPPVASLVPIAALGGFSSKQPLGPGSGLVEGTLPLVNFIKRQYFANVIEATLRHQARPYALAEDAQAMTYIEHKLGVAAGKDQGGFWMRSQEVQQAEVAHADIRRGLEQAGF